MAQEIKNSHVTGSCGEKIGLLLKNHSSLSKSSCRCWLIFVSCYCISRYTTIYPDVFKGRCLPVWGNSAVRVRTVFVLFLSYKWASFWKGDVYIEQLGWKASTALRHSFSSQLGHALHNWVESQTSQEELTSMSASYDPTTLRPSNSSHLQLLTPARLASNNLLRLARNGINNSSSSLRNPLSHGHHLWRPST